MCCHCQVCCPDYRLGDQRKTPSCLIYPEWNWTEHVFVFGGIDLIFFDVIGLVGKSKFLFFEAN
jgi:gentisate 1,2-dioxygenase